MLAALNHPRWLFCQLKRLIDFASSKSSEGTFSGGHPSRTACAGEVGRRAVRLRVEGTAHLRAPKRNE